MIDQATVDKIIDAANIVEVVSDFVTLRKRGVNYTGLCPFHDEKTPSFSVSPSKGICKCFSCGKGGNAVHFIMEHEQLSFYEAVKYLARKYNIEIQERELSPEQKQAQSDRESMLIVNTFAQEYFSNLLFNHIEGRGVGLSYFHERGFHDDILRKFQLGYALDERDAFSKAALQKGFKEEFLLKTGLSLESQYGKGLSDRFKGRVIFPVFGLSGKVVAFGGRVLKQHEKTAKYVNSPESEVYHKSNELYGIYQAKQAIVKNDSCFLVEGYTDVLSMHQCGIEHVVASSGTALTPGQIRLIHRFTNNITVIYDGDAAGIKASIRGIDLLLKEGMNIKVVLLPDGDDPDSFSKKQSAESFNAYIKEHETDFIRFKTNLLLADIGSDPIKRAGLISDIVQSISYIPDPIVRSVYIQECSRLLEVSEPLLIREVNKTQKRQREEGDIPIKRSVAENNPLPIDTAKQKEVNQPNVPPTPKPGYFERFERNLIKYIIRYGERTLFTEGEKAWSVAAYITADLKQDEISWETPLYQRIAEEAIQIASETNSAGSVEHHFLNHMDSEISRLSVDLVSEKYQLSKIHTKFQKVECEEERLTHLVPRALFELKEAIIQAQIVQKQEELRLAARNKENDRTHSLMEELVTLSELKAVLCKQLGERIVLR